MRRTLTVTVIPLAALTLTLASCSSGSSNGSPRAAGKPSNGASSSSGQPGTKATCTKVQADLRDAPKAVVPSTSDPGRTLRAARDLADRLDADVRGSDDAELRSAVGQVAQVFRDIATAGAGGDTSGIVQSISKIGESGRRIAQICARAGVTG